MDRFLIFRLQMDQEQKEDNDTDMPSEQDKTSILEKQLEKWKKEWEEGELERYKSKLSALHTIACLRELVENQMDESKDEKDKIEQKKNEIKQQKGSDSDDEVQLRKDLCIICKANANNYACLPCGHLLFCEKCKELKITADIEITQLEMSNDETNRSLAISDLSRITFLLSS